jgi:hypothetical protein
VAVLELSVVLEVQDQQLLEVLVEEELLLQE